MPYPDTTPPFVPLDPQQGNKKRYNPNREAMLAQLLSSGMGGSNDWGQMIGNLAKVFVGSRGLKKQGRLRMEEQEQSRMAEQQQKQQGRESLAQLLSGMGINVDAAGAGVLSQNSPVMGELLQRSRPQEPKTDAQRRIVKGPDGRNYYADTQEPVLPDVQAPEPAAPPEPDPKTIKGRDGFNYWLTGPQAGTAGFAGG